MVALTNCWKLSTVRRQPNYDFHEIKLHRSTRWTTQSTRSARSSSTTDRSTHFNTRSPTTQRSTSTRFLSTKEVTSTRSSSTTTDRSTRTTQSTRGARSSSTTDRSTQRPTSTGFRSTRESTRGSRSSSTTDRSTFRLITTTELLTSTLLPTTSKTVSTRTLSTIYRSSKKPARGTSSRSISRSCLIAIVVGCTTAIIFGFFWGYFCFIFRHRFHCLRFFDRWVPGCFYINYSCFCPRQERRVDPMDFEMELM